MKRFSFYIIGAFIILSLSTGIYLKQPVNIAQAQPPPDIEDFFDDLTEEFERQEKEKLRIENKQETQEVIAEEIVNTGVVPCDPGALVCTTVDFTINNTDMGGGLITVTLSGYPLASNLAFGTGSPNVEAPSDSVQTLAVACSGTFTCSYTVLINFGGSFISPAGVSVSGSIPLGSSVSFQLAVEKTEIPS